MVIIAIQPIQTAICAARASAWPSIHSNDLLPVHLAASGGAEDAAHWQQVREGLRPKCEQ